jgi:Tol biopolymer transport system component
MRASYIPLRCPGVLFLQFTRVRAMLLGLLRTVRSSRGICTFAAVSALLACGDSSTSSETHPLVDDRLVAFVSDSGTACCGHSSIFVMHADGSHTTRLTSGDFADGSPAWSPDGSTIAFTTDRSPAGIWVVNADGSNVRPLITAPDFLAPGEAAWSPDGRSIAFSGAVKDSLNNFIGVIEIADADGSHARQLMTMATDVASPSWSPDGTRMLFVAAPDGIGQHIYEINTNGTLQRQLSNQLDRDPRWSPDGHQIAFTSVDTTDFQTSIRVAVMNEDGSARRVLTPHDANRKPAWSPDGRQIAYEEYRRDSSTGVPHSRRRIFRMNSDGSDQHAMTPDSAQSQLTTSQAPAWKPTP